MPRTKIVATLGPAISGASSLKNMFEAGVNVFRLNASHGSWDDHLTRIASMRAVLLDRYVTGSVKGEKTSLSEHARAHERRLHRHREQGTSGLLALQARADRVHSECESDRVEARIDERVALNSARIQSQRIDDPNGRIGSAVLQGEIERDKRRVCPVDINVNILPQI